MEQLHDWLISWIPPDSILNDPQKIVEISLVGNLILFGVIIYLLALYRRDTRVNHEQPDTKLDLEVAERWHDDLINMVNNQEIDRKQYRKYCRMLKFMLGYGYGGYGPMSAKVKKLWHEQGLKYAIARRINRRFNLPSSGLIAWQRLVSMAETKKEKPKFGTKQ